MRSHAHSLPARADTSPREGPPTDERRPAARPSRLDWLMIVTWLGLTAGSWALLYGIGRWVWKVLA